MYVLAGFGAFAATRGRSIAWYIRVASRAICWNVSRFWHRNSPF